MRFIQIIFTILFVTNFLFCQSKKKENIFDRADKKTIYMNKSKQNAHIEFSEIITKFKNNKNESIEITSDSAIIYKESNYLTEYKIEPYSNSGEGTTLCYDSKANIIY